MSTTHTPGPWQDSEGWMHPAFPSAVFPSKESAEAHAEQAFAPRVIAERDRLKALNEELVRALGRAADQIAYLQELSGTDKYGPLDALAEARALLERMKS